MTQINRIPIYGVANLLKGLCSVKTENEEKENK